MCTLAETNSNRRSRTMDTSSNQRNGPLEWPREGLRCTPTKPAVLKVELWTDPVEPNKTGLWTNHIEG